MYTNWESIPAGLLRSLEKEWLVSILHDPAYPYSFAVKRSIWALIEKTSEGKVRIVSAKVGARPRNGRDVLAPDQLPDWARDFLYLDQPPVEYADMEAAWPDARVKTTNMWHFVFDAFESRPKDSVVVSGYVEGSDFGASGVLPFPFSKAALMRTVESVYSEITEVQGESYVG